MSREQDNLMRSANLRPHYKVKQELNKMTCQDCIHFNKDKHPESFPNSRYGYCERRVADGYCEYPLPECEICKFFEQKEDSWESVSK